MLGPKTAEDKNPSKKVCKLYILRGIGKLINPFPTKVPLIYPLKTPEVLQTGGFMIFFTGYISGTLIENGLNL